ncbi:saccharopine dehydrogenase [Streptomyces sp. NPDC004111]|uniref:saccharopine dehydrogenase n=1 Tax=Streptomyces sp. NPDC004111 TaxID=3364690 RepID=UPI0036B4A20F
MPERQLTSLSEKPLLILGGSGQAGSDTAALLRRWYPELPLTLAGRDLGRARRVADALGGATAVTVDLRRADLGLPSGPGWSAVVAALWDQQQNALHYAQQHGVPYLSISSGLVEIAPEVVATAHRPTAAPVLMASHFCAGILTLATLGLAREFDRIDTLRVRAALDESDVGGPAGVADLARWTTAGTAGLVRRDSVFTWVNGPDAEADVPTGDGTVLPGVSVAVLDVPSLARATGAPNVRFDMAVGRSPARRHGEPAPFEARIDIEGVGPTGAPLRVGRRLVHPRGQRPVTALGIALGVERLLGLRGEPVPPGLHTPESLIDPAHATRRLRETGATFLEAADGGNSPSGDRAACTVR